MIKNSSISWLKGKKNLLAFSAGGDSTALLFLLLKHNIKFDIAIVNYNIREQSIDEVKYAQKLATNYNFNCFIHSASNIEKNFESKAREIRYNFFEELIEKHNYENLLTAHHLGDRFEWMLMQFCKGAGCVEIAGMRTIELRDSYTIVRPLLHLDKKELLTYLQENKLKYFEDETNLDESIKRNSFRHNYSTPLLEKYLNGIKKSFNYLYEDREILIPTIEIKTINNFAYFQSSNTKRGDIFYIDKYLKSKNYMLSAKERESLKIEKTLIVGRKFIVTFYKDSILISPYFKKQITLPKEFKEKMRILKIEPKLRGYLFENQNILELEEKLFRRV